MLKANETQLQVLLGGRTQYVVPPFQRPYRWGRNQWRTLWEDIMELRDSESPGHFLGSVVTLSQGGTPEGVARFLLIDGQQRLTTLSLLLAALRDWASNEEPEVAERIHGVYLQNQFAQGADRLKVLPTQADRQAFEGVVDRIGAGSGSLVKEAYRFFSARLKGLENSNQGVTAHDFETTILSKIEIVSITLGPDDNPHRIFESLNGKGTPLTQADLFVITTLCVSLRSSTASYIMVSGNRCKKC